MANKEHYNNLITLSKDKWNTWRKESLNVFVEKKLTFLVNANLSIDLKLTLIKGNFENYNFINGDYQKTIFKDCVFKDCDFNNSNFYCAKFINCKLIDCDLGHSNIREATFKLTEIINTYFGHSNLAESYFEKVEFNICEFHNTIFYRTSFTEVKGLETSIYRGHSSFDIFSIDSWKLLPLSFIRGLGVPEFLIESMQNIDKKAIDFYSCFISYSNEDYLFANKIYVDLQNAGIRCWFAPEDMKIGDKIRTKIDESIKIFDKLLLILSSSSVNSMWVEHEVENAFEKEVKTKVTNLFPIRIDNSVMNSESGWASKIRRERHIGDFTSWQSKKCYNASFIKLLENLKTQ